MKKVLQNSISLFMAFVVLFSTMSFTVDKHYCGDTLIGMAIFKEARSCGMEMQNSDLPSECSPAKKNCCTNSQISIEGQDELKISFDSLSFQKQVFITSFLHSYFDIFEIDETHTTTDFIHPPPEIVRSIYKLDEVYLI